MEDVNKLTKEEFLKFLNCTHNSTKTETITFRGPKNSAATVVKRFGNYSACNVKIKEFSLNKQILRIPLPKVNFEGLSPGQVAYRFRKPKSCKRRIKSNEIVSRFGRRIKVKKFVETFVPNTRVTRSSPKNKVLRVNNNSNLIKSKQKMDYQHPKTTEILMKTEIKKEKIENQAVTEFLHNNPKFNRKYYLKPPPLEIPVEGRLEYGFNDLVRDIKNMKLPSPTWKIKVVVRSTKISSIIFTNKCVLERTVTFNSKSDLYEIVIENKPAILLGSPGEVSCVEDIEILLNIIHTINADDIMIRYKD